MSLLGYEGMRHSLWLHDLLYFALLCKFSERQKVDGKSAFSKTTSVTQRLTNHGNKYSDHLNPGTVSYLCVLWKLMFSPLQHLCGCCFFFLLYLRHISPKRLIQSYLFISL